MAKKKTTGEEIQLNKVREMIRSEIDKNYGGITKFLNSDKGKSLGGKKIRCYLYDSGAVNYEVIRKLCKYLGIGVLTRKIVVSRTILYQLDKTINPTIKTSKNV